MMGATNKQEGKKPLADRLSQLVVFSLDEQRYALDLAVVERVVGAVEITPLPKAPEIVLGLVNFQGEVVPVFNVRKRFRLPEREMLLSDRLILARASRRKVALLVDVVSGVIGDVKQRMTTGPAILPGLEYVEGVAKLENGLTLIHNLDEFLSLGEEKALTAALKAS